MSGLYEVRRGDYSKADVARAAGWGDRFAPPGDRMDRGTRIANAAAAWVRAEGGPEQPEETT